MMSAWAWNHHGARKQLARWLVHPQAFRRAAGWHATSPEEAQEIESLGFRQPACVAPNGVDIPTPDETATAARFWHTRCPDTASKMTAVFYGRFHVKKRLIELIDVWLEKAPSEWLLLLVGIPESYTPEMLEAYATRMGGAGRVRAFAGNDSPPPYAVASLFLLPSHNENFGLVIAEALASGVPALVTNTTPWNALNANGAGWCVPWDSYADALGTATRERDDRRRQRGEIGRAWVSAMYSWDEACRPLLEFYDRLTQPSKASR
jgi:glycosyltransferase involved in cell wall biosynthesis